MFPALISYANGTSPLGASIILLGTELLGDGNSQICNSIIDYLEETFYILGGSLHVLGNLRIRQCCLNNHVI